ncbi:MAG: hypothetical protein ABI807_15150 [Sporichthyaceae bacterium]
MPVLAVPADEGFWVGHGTARLWVQLRGSGESTPHVGRGDLVSFTGTVVAHDRRFADRVGVDESEGADELTRQRFHLAVSAADLHVPHP